MGTKFYITDVFGTGKYSGNQLATFVNSAHLSDIEMQQIAREINFSETTFILSDKESNGSWDVRIFTPEEEIDFAGHPTLGTAFIINNFLLSEPGEKIVLNLKVGQIPVHREGPLLWMKQIQPVFKKSYEEEFIASMLSITASDIDSRYPILETSTGLPFTIVPVRKLKTLKKARINNQIYDEFCKQTEAKGILVFSPESYQMCEDLAVRVFVEYLGIPEDPATGSANGCLAAYLLKNNYFKKDKIDIVVGQGYEIGRDAELFLRASLTDNQYNIEVGGRVYKIAEGLWD